MKKRLALFMTMVMAVALFVTACGAEVADDVSDETNESIDKVENSSGTADSDKLAESNSGYTVMEPIVFTGTGDTIIRDVNISQGLHIVHSKYYGEHNFIAVPYDDAGERQGCWVNEIGSYEGSCIYTEELSGGLVEVTASGDWEITIYSPENEGTSNFSGYGDCVTPFFSLESGALIVASHYVGESNFIGVVYDETGKRCDCIVNEIDSYDGESIFNEGKPGMRYCMEIMASGEWTIDFGLTDEVTQVSNCD